MSVEFKRRRTKQEKSLQLDWKVQLDFAYGFCFLNRKVKEAGQDG
jgi:hypothetical protein